MATAFSDSMEILYIALIFVGWKKHVNRLSFVCGQQYKTDICITEYYIMKVYLMDCLEYKSYAKFSTSRFTYSCLRTPCKTKPKSCAHE